MRKTQQILALLFIMLTTIASAQEGTLTVKGKVYDKDTQKGIDKAEVRLYNEASTVLKTATTNAQGQYQLELQSGVERFKVEAQAKNYNQAEVLVTKSQEQAVVDFGLNRQEVAKVNLPIVFFDFDSSYLTTLAKEELKQVVAFLKEDKTVRLRVNAHTDSRGTNTYNDWLSARRGQRVIDWLVQQGVEAHRLEEAHFGKTQLSNDCTEGAKCSAEQHRENRRCSFEIIK